MENTSVAVSVSWKSSFKTQFVLLCSHTDIIAMFVSISELGCGSPPQVKHTEVQFSLTTLGSMPEYICHPGFTSVPSATQSITGIQAVFIIGQQILILIIADKIQSRLS